MPGMDGLEATKAIHKLPGYQTIPILALTANVFDEDGALSLRAGMDAEISKPVIHVLEGWLPPSSAPEPSVSPHPDDDLRRRLSVIPGLNVAKGLRFASGRLDRYVRRLQVYAQSQAAACHALLQASMRADYDEARQLAHSLSGAAAFIGAEDVQRLARSLESLLRNAASAEEIESTARATHRAEVLLLAAIARLPQEADALTAQ